MSKAIVYSNTDCTYCTQLKTYLTEQGISYEERVIDQNEGYAEELHQMGMMSVPVTVIGEMKIVGLNPTRIKKAVAALEQSTNA